MPKKRLFVEDRVYEYLKHIRCRDLKLVPGELSRDYDEIIRNTRTQSEIARELGLAKSSVARAIGEMTRDENVLVYRFQKNGTYIPNDEYDPSVHVSSVARVAYRSNKEKYIGERLLEALGGNLVAPLEILPSLSVSTNVPDLEDKELRLHFVAGSSMMNLTISRSAFERNGALPITIFLAQASALDVSDSRFVPTEAHVRSFDGQVIVLRLPTQSLYLPSKFGYGQCFGERSIPAFGNIALTFYPSGQIVWITQLLGWWSPTYGKLTDQHLAIGVKTDENGRKKSLCPNILDFDRWSRQGRLWPEPLQKISRDQPPELTNFFPEDQGRYTNGHSLDHIGSSALKTPKIFDLSPWLEVSRIVLDNDEIELATRSQIESFKSYWDARTWPCQAPCILGFRHFHLAITR